MTTAFELNWQYDLNRAYSPSSAADLANYAFFHLKSTFLGGIGLKDSTQTTIGSPSGLWLVQGSSNGTTGAMDNADRIGVTYTPANIVTGSNSSSHSWIVLKHPTLSVYVLLSKITTSSGMKLGMSFQPYTGGSSTVDPTTSNEVLNVSNINIGAQIVVNAQSNSHFHGWLSTTGELMWGSSVDGSGVCASFVQVRQATETHTGDNSTWWLFSEYLAAGVLGYAGALTTTTVGTYGWQGRSGTTATAAVAPCVIMPYMITGTNILLDMPSSDPIDGLVQDHEMRLYCNLASHKSKRGRLRDIVWMPVAAGGDRAEPSNPYASAIIGNMGLPWQGMALPPQF